MAGTLLFFRDTNQRMHNKIITFDPELCRPTDVNSLCGDARKAKLKLNWEPTLDTEGLAVLMMEAELA